MATDAAGNSSATTSITATLERDLDDDSIANEIDLSFEAIPASGFSDLTLGGETVGTITSVPTNTAVFIEDVDEPQGLKVTVTLTASPPPSPPNNRVVLQLAGKMSQVKLAVPDSVGTSNVYYVKDPTDPPETTVEVDVGGPAEIEVILNGSPVVISIAEGASASLIETIVGGVLTDITVEVPTTNTDPADVTINGAPVDPGETLAFGTLAAKLSVIKGSFSFLGTFTPGQSSDDTLDPLSEDVLLKIGSYIFTVPGGSFTIASDGAHVFSGTVGGVRLSIQLKSKDGLWNVKANGKRVSGITNPVPVGFGIGDDAGFTTTTGSLK